MGVFVLVAFAYFLSTNRQNINWKTVTVGLLLQWILAMLILGVPLVGLPGLLTPLFSAANDLVMNIISYSDAGAAFLLAR